MWVLFVVGAMLILLGLFVDFRPAWRTLAGWQYKNPSVAEPSDTYFRVQRVATVLAGIIVIGFGFMVYADDTAARPQVSARQQVQNVVNALGASLTGRTSVDNAATANPLVVRQSLARAVDTINSDSGAGTVTVVAASDQGRDHRYTLATGAEEAFCLEITEGPSRYGGIGPNLDGPAPTPDPTALGEINVSFPISTHVTTGACATK